MVASVLRQLKPSLRFTLLMAAIGTIYALVAAATIAASSNGRSHASVWLADALVLAALLGSPRRNWPLIMLAGLVGNHVANDVIRGYHYAHILYGASNIGQVLIAALMLRAPVALSPLTNIKSLATFLLAAGLVAPATGAIFGSLATWWIYNEPFAQSYIVWFASNSLGLVVGTPILVSVFSGNLEESFKNLTRKQRRYMPVVLMVFAMLTFGTFTFDQVPLLFVPVSALVIVAMTLGRVGVMLAILIAAFVAIGAIINGSGPLNLLPVDDFRRAIYFQVYFAFLMLTGMGVATMDTSRTHAMVKLVDREQMLGQLLVHGKDVVMSFDAKGECTFCGGPTLSMLGLSPNEIIGRTVVELAQRIAMPLTTFDVQDTSLKPIPFSLEFQLGSGGKTWVEASMVPIIVEDRLTSSVISLRDVTQQKNAQDELRKRASTDDLTGLLNRGGFHRALEDAVTESRQITLALIDLDNFKAVNDTYGHSSGDEVLVVVAEIIAAHVRSEDVVGRVGGDEFAVIIRAGESVALAVCERICRCVEETKIFATDRRQLNVTVSCGIAENPMNGDRARLLEAADRALYGVKRTGRNGVLVAA